MTILSVPQRRRRADRFLKAYIDFRGGWNTDAAPDNLLDVELMQADNVDLSERGAVSKRKGTTPLNSASYNAEVEQLIEWPRNDGTKILLAVVGTTLCKIDEDGTKTDLQTLASTSIGYFILQDKFFFVDSDKYRYYDGTSVKLVQLDAPSTSPTMTGSGSGTNLTAGTYKGVVVFVNALGVESAASSEASVTITDGQQINWSNIPIGPSDTVARILYRTTDDGSVFKYLTTINDNETTSYTDTTPDTNLGNNLVIDNALTSIKRCKYLMRHPKSFRIFASGDSDDPAVLYYSEPNDPGYFKETSKLYPTTGDGPVTGLSIIGESVLVCYQNSIWAWNGIDPETDAEWSKLPAGQGTVAHRTIALTPNTQSFLGQGGIYCLSPALLDYNVVIMPGEELITNIAKNKVTNVIRSMVHTQTACAVFDTNNERLLLAYGDDPANPKNNNVLVYYWNLGAFTRYTGWQVNDFCLRSNGDLLIATNGYILKTGQGYKDWDPATESYKPINYLVQSKQWSLDFPFRLKKAKMMYLAARQYDVEVSSITITIKSDYDSFKYTDISLDESFTWGEPWGNIWGWSNYITKEMDCLLIGRRYQVIFENNKVDEPVTVYGIAFEYTAKRPEGVRVE